MIGLNNMLKFLHLNGIKRLIFLFLVNKIFVGTRNFSFPIKRKLLISIGIKIGNNSKIVGPIECTGTLIIGDDCWIGKNFKVNGNGKVIIGNRCDIGPEVTFQTGSHQIGNRKRRAGEGVKLEQNVGSGTWIGGRTTILNNIVIGNSCVIAGCSCVVKDIEDNILVGGVPAKIIRRLGND